MKTRYILVSDSDSPNEPIWLPLNSAIYDLNINNIIWAIYGPNSGPAAYCNMLCDVNTHEKYIEIEKFGASNPLELIMKLDLYPNLYLEI